MSIGALIDKFRSVALDRIERMNLAMVSLERDPQDAEASEEVLREIHTLKGEAKMMGFADINLVAHQTESLMMASQEADWTLTGETVDAIFSGFDLIRALLTKTAGSNDDPVDLSEFVERIQHAQQQLTAEPESGEGGGSAPQPEPLERQEPPPPSPDSGQPIAAAGEEEDATPPTPDAPTESSSSSPAAASAGRRATRAKVTTTASGIPAVDKDGHAPSKTRSGKDSGSAALRLQAQNSLRVRFDKLERLGDVASEVMLMSRRMDHHLQQLSEWRDHLREWMKMTEPNLPKSHLAQLRELRHRFDAMTTEVSEDNHLVELRTTQLDDEVRTLRHIPLSQVISHYPRAVRDLAQGQRKRVRFLHDVGNVEVDRAVLSSLSDPLLHLVRNAVDHGIETPEERKAAGKEPEAEVSLHVEHIGDSLRVVLSDDGRGIDPEVITERAVAKGVITPEETQDLDDQQALALIFEPGFSTRAEVSDVSGRGIGMDIVLRQITTLGGVVEVESEVGEGTQFTLLVPLSSAVIEVLLVRFGEETFCLQAKDIERVARVTPKDLVEIHGSLSVRLDGQLMPLVDWRPALVGEPGDIQKMMEEGRSMSLLIAQQGTRRMAAWVDEVIGEREAINRPLGDFLQNLRLCRGAAMTDAGEVLPLLNVIELMSRSKDSGATPSVNARRAWSTMHLKNLPQTRTILVAEDSEVTRALVSGILRGLGYRVVEAEDGMEALETLRESRVDLLMTDIQMPRMDGLSLLKHVRDDPRIEDLPVIVLSTLGSAADKEHAMRLGADSYLVKLDFREQELVSTVRRYLKG